MELSRDEIEELGISIGRSFSPAAPINERALFAGRTAEVRQVIDAVNQRGQHAIIFGERGVGKTSLANVLSDYLAAVAAQVPIIAPRVNCEGADDFSSLWRKVFKGIIEVTKVRRAGFASEDAERLSTLAERLPKGEVRPDEVKDLLDYCGENSIVVVIIDEFDRLPNGKLSAKMADTLKMLSDHSARATLVLVGVADSVDDLIHEHQSVERAVAQIRMPRMSDGELLEILERGLGAVEMSIDGEAASRITHLSQGLPHYTHLLGLHAGREAIDYGRRGVEPSDVDSAIQKAITGAQETIQSSYHRATMSQRSDSLFPQALLACALAATDSLGFFAAGDVREPMSKIMGRSFDIPAFARHLNSFCEVDRGPVLQKTGVPHRYRFRFVNPLLQPYVTMKGLASGLIDVETWKSLAHRGDIPGQN